MAAKVNETTVITVVHNRAEITALILADPVVAAAINGRPVLGNATVEFDPKSGSFTTTINIRTQGGP